MKTVIITKKSKTMKAKIGVLAVFIVFATALQGNAQNQKRNSCVNGISNLSEQQKATLADLETTYQAQMADYRAERQSSTNVETKAAIREQMLQARTAHRAEVNNLLTADQQREYAAWQAGRQSKGNKQAVGQGGKKGKRNGYGRGGNCKGRCVTNS